MVKNLCIVACMLDDASIILQDKKNDFLALNLDAMVSLESHGIDFITVDKFFSGSEYIEQVDRGLLKLEIILKKLDRAYRHIARFPKSFSGNIYSFHTIYSYIVFADLLVEHLLAARYKKITLLTSFTEQELDEPVDKAYVNIHRRKNDRDRFFLAMLRDALEANIQQVQQLPFDSSILSSQGRIQAKINHILYEGVWKYISRQIRNRFFNSENRSSPVTVLYVQQGYEVGRLRSDLRAYNGVNAISFDAYQSREARPDNSTIDQFDCDLQECCGRYVTVFKDILVSYLAGEVNRIAHFVEQVEKQLQTIQPSIAIYSAGPATLCENVYAYLLKKYEIDMYLFQHSGSELFFSYPPFEKYVQGEGIFKSYMVVATEKDKELKGKNIQGKIWVGGHAKSREVFNFYRRKYMTNGRVLFLAAWPPFNFLPGWRFDDSEAEFFQKHKELLTISKKYDLPLDIKVFPSLEYARPGYYKKLSALCGHHKIRLIGNPRAEYLLPKYDLIIAETVSSTLTHYLLCADVPVIFFLRNKDHFRPEVIDDIENRFYIATDKVELEYYVRLFSKGKLPSKYSEKFVEKLVTPLAIDDPGRYISQYICQTSLHPPIDND